MEPSHSHTLAAAACQASPVFPLRRSSLGSTTLDIISREEPALAPIELLHLAIMAAELRANCDTAVAPASKTEWYAGATRFELELEVRYSIPCENAPPRCQSATVTSLKQPQFVQSLSNPYYLHHLCVQKYFEDDAFVEWCKYLKYFSQPEYLPFLSYVSHYLCPVALFLPFLCAEKLKIASRLSRLPCDADINTATLAPLSRRWTLSSRSSSVRTSSGRMLLRI